jgi:hypothetical protein
MRVVLGQRTVSVALAAAVVQDQSVRLRAPTAVPMVEAV